MRMHLRKLADVDPNYERIEFTNGNRVAQKRILHHQQIQAVVSAHLNSQSSREAFLTCYHSAMFSS